MTPGRDRWVDGGLDRIPLPPGRSGALWVCGKWVVGPDPEAALDRADGAGLVVCLNEREELRDFPSYADWLDANAGGRALWHPVADLHAPSVDATAALVAAVVARIDDGVVIHCAGGLGRAPTLAICALVELGMTAGDALDLVRAHRPGGGPEAGAQHRLVAAYANRR